MEIEGGWGLNDDEARTQDQGNPVEEEPNFNVKHCRIDTRVPGRSADHSFSGVLFDVTSKGKTSEVENLLIHCRGSDSTLCNYLLRCRWPIRIDAVSCCGVLGRMSIFGCPTSWRIEPDLFHNSQRWDTLHEGFYDESWDVPMVMVLDVPIIIEPGQTQAIYVHSAARGDRGVRYQGFWSSKSMVGEDDCISIHPGKGHTSAIPFDTRYGWYRGHRGLAGSLHYSLSVPPWSPSTHKHYPAKFQENVKMLLLANRRRGNILSLIAKDELLRIVECLPWDAFGTGNVKAASRERGIMENLGISFGRAANDDGAIEDAPTDGQGSRLGSGETRWRYAVFLVLCACAVRYIHLVPAIVLTMFVITFLIVYM